MSRLYLSNPCAFFTTHCTRCCGRIQRPAFPAPSSMRGSKEYAKLRHKSCRGDEHVCLPVIASEAKQSSFLRQGKKAGLLRRFAPRNDGGCCLKIESET